MTMASPSRRLRIALIAEHVHRRGGQERVTAELVTRLAARHEIHLFCFSAADIPPEVTVHRLWCPFRSSTLQALLIVLLSALRVRMRDFDVVMSQGGNSLRQNFVIVHTCHASRARAAARPHPLQPREARPYGLLRRLRNRWASAMEGRAVRRCPGRVIAVSGTLARALAAQHGVRREDILVAPNGVDHEVFNLEARRRYRERVRAELGLGPEEFVVLFVGGLWFEKGLAPLVWALSHMSTPARLLVVGKGDEAWLRQLAAQAGVADRVLCVGPQAEVQRYYGAADCFAFPSEAEGFGLVMAEAAACGLPLVTTEVGIAEYLVEDGRTGFTITRDPRQIAQRLEVLAGDPALRERMGQEAHRRAQALTWDRQADLIERLFLEKTEPRAVLRLVSRAGPKPRGRLRVAVLSHSCVVDVNQRLYADLARTYPDLELLLVAPDHWWNPLSGVLSFAALPETAPFSHPLPVHLSGHMHLYWYASRRLGELLREFRPQVVLVDEEPYSLAAYQGARLAVRLGARLLLYTKQNLYRSYPPPICWTQAWVLRHLDRALVVSPESEQVLRRRGYGGPVTVLPHGVDAEAFSPGSGQDLREQLGLRGPVIGFAGRLEERKGVLDLLEAARLLRQGRGDGFHLLLVGTGPLREQAARFAAEHLAPGQAVQLGYVAHHDMPKYMRAMDVLALPSRTTRKWKEQFGRVLLEALACGVPVVGSDSGYIPHLIRQMGGGLVFPEGKAEQLAEQLGWLLDHPREAKEIGQRGREVVVREFSSVQVARRLYEALQATVA